MNKKSAALALSAVTLATAMTATVIAAPNDTETPKLETVVVTNENTTETETPSTETPETENPTTSEAPSEEESPAPEESVPVESEPVESVNPETPPSPEVGEIPEIDGVETHTYTPDAIGTISFGNLPNRVKQNNFTALSLQESINSLNVMDYEEMEDDLRDNLNSLAGAIWAGGSYPTIPVYDVEYIEDSATGKKYPVFSLSGQSTVDSYAVTSLENTYSSLEKTYDDLREGKLQEDNAAIISQLQDAQNALVQAAEGIYVGIIEMQNGLISMYRGLSSLDRTIAEMELRYTLGHVSALTVQEIKASRTSLYSNIASAESGLDNMKTQLALFTGANLSSGLSLSALPEISDSQLSAMNEENDLVTAKGKSYELFSAARSLEDAEEQFEEADDNYGDNDYMFTSAKHQFESAQYTYNATVQNFEASFRVLFTQVKDFRQVLGASYTTLAVEQSNYEVAELKHSQGQISDNALLTAKDDLSTAQDAVASAKIDLFTAYNNYQWAVNYGKLN